MSKTGLLCGVHYSWHSRGSGGLDVAADAASTLNKWAINGDRPRFHESNNVVCPCFLQVLTRSSTRASKAVRGAPSIASMVTRLMSLR